jgi:hypothetical protein
VKLTHTNQRDTIGNGGADRSYMLFNVVQNSSM